MAIQRFDIVEDIAGRKLLVVSKTPAFCICVLLGINSDTVFLDDRAVKKVSDCGFLSKLLRLASQDLQEAIILTKRTPFWKRVLKKMKVLR